MQGVELEAFRAQWEDELRNRNRNLNINQNRNNDDDGDQNHNNNVRQREEDGGGENENKFLLSPMSERKRKKHQLKKALLGTCETKVKYTSAHDWEIVEAGDQAKFSFFQKLDVSVVVRIMAKMNVRDLISMMSVCRSFFRTALDPRLWRALCFRSFAEDTELSEVCATEYRRDWRRMVMRRPRLRRDGIYVAKISYYRKGQAEFSFYSPLLKVEYWRYLRFFEDGTCIWAMSFDAPFDKEVSEMCFVLWLYAKPPVCRRRKRQAYGVC